MDNSIQAHQKELCNKLWAMANSAAPKLTDGL